MMETSMEGALSLERFARYLDWAAGDPEKALELYTLNTRLSEAFYAPLHALEIALRNRIHTVMSVHYGAYWFDVEGVPKTENQVRQLAEARHELEAAGKEVTAGRLVAALTFSFWTSVVSPPENEDLWRSTLHKIASDEHGKRLTRKAFSGPLARVRTLRNRIAHHEPILYWTLPKHHRAMVDMTGWLSPVIKDWLGTVDRFLEVYPAEGYRLEAVDK